MKKTIFTVLFATIIGCNPLALDSSKEPGVFCFQGSDCGCFKCICQSDVGTSGYEIANLCVDNTCATGEESCIYACNKVMDAGLTLSDVDSGIVVQFKSTDSCDTSDAGAY